MFEKMVNGEHTLKEFESKYTNIHTKNEFENGWKIAIILSLF